MSNAARFLLGFCFIVWIVWLLAMEGCEGRTDQCVDRLEEAGQLCIDDCPKEPLPTGGQMADRDCFAECIGGRDNFIYSLCLGEVASDGGTNTAANEHFARYLK